MKRFLTAETVECEEVKSDQRAYFIVLLQNCLFWSEISNPKQLETVCFTMYMHSSIAGDGGQSIKQTDISPVTVKHR